MSLITSILDYFNSIYQIISTRQRVADPAYKTGGREALKDMAATIQKQVALTNRMLQHMETNNNVAINVLTVNP